MSITNLSKSEKEEQQVFHDVKQHMDLGFQETDRRTTGKNRIGSISFNEADELFRSWLDENTWPYDALLFDPRIFTFIFEKTSRLISNKPKGRLTPREGSDVLSARINNSLLDYQWDNANIGGTMLSKWSLMDINARKYGSGFALTRWRYELDGEGNVVFDGPDMQVLNNRDIAHDLSATAIENCNWFQVRQYVTIQDLERVNDAARTGPVFKNLDKLKEAVRMKESKDSIGGGGDSRSTNWISRNRAISGLELDPIGKDDVFKTIEIVTEYRRDRWISFAPKHGVVIRDIPNPYKNNEIPVVMLRYYSIDDDLYGLSEIEPVKGIQKAINALLCQYVDEINQKLYSPIAIGPGVRQHTLEWGKGARWIMNNPNADFRLVESKSNAAQYFQNTYSVLVAAMMNALGESSLGISNSQPYQTDKTATEVKALQLQRNSRDQYNQIFLAEAIKRQYMLWHSMNQALLFSDPKSAHYLIRVAGDESMKYFQQRGLHEYDVSAELVSQKFTHEQIRGKKDDSILESSQVPRFPVMIGDEVKPKLSLEDGSTKSGSLYIEPSDIKGTFDFSIDVESMQVTADEERRQARQTAVTTLSTNPNVHELLAAEGVRPKFKELFVQWLEDLGFSDAERFFESSPASNPMEAIMGGAGGAGGAGKEMSAPVGRPPSGIPGGTNPNSGGESEQSSPFAVDRVRNEGLGPISPTSLKE
jgi:hypothetical protein